MRSCCGILFVRCFISFELSQIVVNPIQVLMEEQNFIFGFYDVKILEVTS